MTTRSVPLFAIALLTLSFIACGPSEDADADSSPDARAASADASAPGTAKAGGGAAKSSANEHELASNDGAFRITLPAGFEDPTESVKEMGKDVELHKFVASNGANEAVMITYAIVPSWFFKSGDTTGILDLLRDGDVVGAKITKEREVRIGGYPGRSYFWSQRDSTGPHFGRSVHYIVPPRVYQITYLSTISMKMVDSPENTKFFESFTLTSAPAR